MLNYFKNRPTTACVIVAALGYFVDAYDLVLFNILRKPSLEALGYSGEELVTVGGQILSIQMYGMLIGGILWGVLGDKKGRISVLFGSILMYSVASILNAFVTDVFQYSLLRFIAGIGLAGELGAGVTLVTEIMDKEKRGWGTTIVASVGVAGVVAACLFAKEFDWRTSYILGGVMGLMLLVLRIAVHESGLFAATAKTEVSRGNFFMLFTNKERTIRYLSCIAIAIPIWFVVGILITFAPEITAELGMVEKISAIDAVMYAYIGFILGDLSSGVISQLLRSRKKVIGGFLSCSLLFCIYYLNLHQASTTLFYSLAVALGFSGGFWAVFITTAAEQFGTNLRATVATTAPNFVRGAAAPMTTAFIALKHHYGKVGSASIVGVVCFLLAFLALSRLKESYGKDLDFIES